MTSVDTRRAPERFTAFTTAVHRLIPAALRKHVPLTFVGYAFINGSAFLLDITCLWIFNNHLHIFYPLAVTIGYAIAGLYSLTLNKWLNFQAPGHAVAQGSKYAVGLASQYVIFILGLSSFLHWQLGINAEVARVISACCEGIYLYLVMRFWVFREKNNA
ncbi:GtrA family protein [Actinomyces vulturis]|uniref:GtrA family protein n=1 Tax=Actinomyces vulturis TaxID=1857645 RepID=UPI0009F20D8E|nr:GtrA family protein [Actinomyces vulturis]